MNKKSILLLLILPTFLISAQEEKKDSKSVNGKKEKKVPQKTKNSKPNFLVIMGDDIGWFNISAYNMGIMGYRTPNIDKIAREGALCTDFYSQQSCTAGRAAFITGQSPIRTGLTKIGFPGGDSGLKKEDPTIAELLKPLGYACGHFGKNHLGDLDEMLPTNHGFDEFFGNLYHLNAQEEPESPDYPKNPEFKKKFGPRGVIHSFAKGTIKDTGPLTTQRMKTIDDETLKASLKFIEQSHKASQPFFLWWNATRMHIWTHLKKESEGKTGFGVYADGMVEHDKHVGKLLNHLETLGIADNTIVVYVTDNGAEVFSWPDGGMTPFRGEKDTNWEGGFRVPCLIKWPNVIKPGTIYNDMLSLEDFFPTFLAAAGNPTIKEQLLKGHTVGNIKYKVYLDGFNLLPFFKQEKKNPRQAFFYWNDEGELTALRYENWKVVFAEQRAHGLETWQEEFTQLRLPKLFNLRSDPFERADRDSINYGKWRIEHLFMLIPAQKYVANYLATFKEFPPRQKVASLNLKKAMEKMSQGAKD